MAFIPRNFYSHANLANSSTSFTPLFRLLDDFDTYSRQNGSTPSVNACQGVRRSQNANVNAIHTWQPKFDVRETAEAYELHGELPGMVKENVHIEFTDPQIMLIRGRSERTYTTGFSSLAAAATAIEDNTTTSAAVTEQAEGRRSPYQARVEDDDEEEDKVAASSSGANEGGWEDVSSVKKHEEVNDEEEIKEEQAVAAAASAPVDTAKYWLTERNIGEFTRSFNFPTRVEQSTVSAALKDGILTVVIPKAKKHEALPILIN